MQTNKFTYFLAISLCFLFTGCKGKKINEAKEVLNEFQNYYIQDDFDNVIKLYPSITELTGLFYKMDVIDVENGDVKGDTVILNTKIKWTNPLGKVYDAPATFYMLPKKMDEKKRYIIHDTKGFVSFEDYGLYKYALKKEKGLSSLTNVSKSNIIYKYSSEFAKTKDLVKKMISNKLVVSGMSWQTGYYSNVASGRATVTNKSGMDLPDVKYKITYYSDSKSNTIITTDEGYVSWSSLRPNETKSFSWYTSPVRGAHAANIEIFVDNDDFIENGAIEFAEFEGPN